MDYKRIIYFCVISTVVFTCVSGAIAAPFMFNAGPDSNARFGWTNGRQVNQQNGSMGSPEVDASGFHFVNSFPADPLDMTIGPGDIFASAEVMVEVDTRNAAGGPQPGISTITIREEGTYSSSDPEGDFTGWGSAMLTFVGSPFFGGFVSSVPLPAPTFTETSKGFGTWTMEVVWQIGDPLLDTYFQPGTASHPDINNPLFPWEFFEIRVENDLFLTPDGVDNGSSLSKTRMDILVPEPGSVLLVMLAVGPLALRRSRRRGA